MFSLIAFEICPNSSLLFTSIVETFFVLWLIKSKNEVKPVWIAASGERYFDTMK
ncbi:hypothetical protein [Campylobacter jejuni]|uniref:hypothetical protein n=1 Tax=Campylobacter jejuni TaxID=197 RepID=UPI0021AD9541|nr:hypothetical protein [Campylobacter jejuni]